MDACLLKYLACVLTFSITFGTSGGHTHAFAGDIGQEVNPRDLESYLHITAHQVSTGLALFYVTYVALEVPSNLAMSKLSPSVWLARIVISVGVIGTAMVGMSNAAGYYVLRLLLGAVEAGMWPGMTFFLTLYYPPHRIAKRIGWVSISSFPVTTLGNIRTNF